MDLIDFICKEVAEFMNGSDFCFDFLCDICSMTCDYSYAQPECWKRYFVEKHKEAQQAEEGE